MAQLADNHALLIYRIGPVLCCAPTDPIQSLISPPALTRPPGSSRSYPGIFRHDGKLVSLIEMRQLLGVEELNRKRPGRIAICQLDDRHIGFLVDEVIDVIDAPASGWGQLAPSLSGGVFTRSLLLENKIHLYAEFEKLHKIRNHGFLKPWLEKLSEKAPLLEEQKQAALASTAAMSAAATIPRTANLSHTAMGSTPATRVSTPAKTENAASTTISSPVPPLAPPSAPSADISRLEPAASSPAATDTDSQSRLPPSPTPEENLTDHQITGAPDHTEEPSQRESSPSHSRQKTHSDKSAPKITAQKTELKIENSSERKKAQTTRLASNSAPLNPVSTIPATRISTNPAPTAPIPAQNSAPRRPSTPEKNPAAKVNHSPSSLADSTPDSTHPATIRADTGSDAAKPATTVGRNENRNENERRSGLFLFTMLLMGIGLICALIYLWPDHDPDSSKVATGRPAAIRSVLEQSSVKSLADDPPNTWTQPVVKTPETITEPAYKQIDEPSPTPVKQTLSQNTPDTRPPQDKPSDYHAAIEQQTKEHGANEVTIILTAPANDEVIRTDASARITQEQRPETSTLHILKENQRPRTGLESTPTMATPSVDEHAGSRAQKSKTPTSLHPINEVLHIVVRGDTLWHIARRYIHNPFRYPELARLNKIRNPDLIYPGDRVRIIRIQPQSVPTSID